MGGMRGLRAIGATPPVRCGRGEASKFSTRIILSRGYSVLYGDFRRPNIAAADRLQSTKPIGSSVRSDPPSWLARNFSAASRVSDSAKEPAACQPGP